MEMEREIRLNDSNWFIEFHTSRLLNDNPLIWIYGKMRDFFSVGLFLSSVANYNTHHLLTVQTNIASHINISISIYLKLLASRYRSHPIHFFLLSHLYIYMNFGQMFCHHWNKFECAIVRFCLFCPRSFHVVIAQAPIYFLILLVYNSNS